MRKYISVTDTAKMIRETLKLELPGVKFSVRSDKYSGGASVDVHWTDGPVQWEVEAIAKFYQGGDFDGMTDSMSYRSYTNEGGEEIHYGADFVFCTRDYSRGFTDEVAGHVARFWSEPKPELNAHDWYDFPVRDRALDRGDGRSSLADYIMQARQNARRVNGAVTFIEPQGNHFNGWFNWVGLMAEMMADGRIDQLAKPETPAAPTDAEPDGWDLNAPWFQG